jgi:hypothetical protein
MASLLSPESYFYQPCVNSFLKGRVVQEYKKLKLPVDITLLKSNKTTVILSALLYSQERELHQYTFRDKTHPVSKLETMELFQYNIQQ